MKTKALLLLLISQALLACGVESTLPPPQTTITRERAVFVSRVEYDVTGVSVTCELNEALVMPGLVVPVFIEFDGIMIERVDIENQSSHTFDEFSPDYSGILVCVVEYASAQFESERQTLNPL